jgi:hypothetical protein
LPAQESGVEREEIRVYYNKVTYVTGISEKMLLSKDSNTPLALLPTTPFMLPENKNTRRALDACARFRELTTHHNSRNALI